MKKVIKYLTRRKLNLEEEMNYFKSNLGRIGVEINKLRYMIRMLEEKNKEVQGE